jgi:hypothetical protein
LPSPLTTDGQEGQLPAQSKTILSRLPIGIQSKWSKKRGAFGISTLPHGDPLDPSCKPDKPRKSARLTQQLVNSVGTLFAGSR